MPWYSHTARPTSSHYVGPTGHTHRLHGRDIDCNSPPHINRDQTISTHCFARLLTAKAYSEWLGSRVVSVLDSDAEGPGFKSQSRRCRVAVLGKLFTPIVRSPSSEIGSGRLKGCGGNCGAGGK